VSEDPLHDGRIREEGEDDQGNALAGQGAPGTGERVRVKHPPQQLVPGETVAARARGGLRLHNAARLEQGDGGVRRRPGEEFSRRAASGQAAVVADGMGVWPGQERGQTAEEVQRIEHQLGRSPWLGPGAAELIEDPAVRGEGKAGGSEGGSEGIAEKPFPTCTILHRHPLARPGFAWAMPREAILRKKKIASPHSVVDRGVVPH
jgi:hypothetical protein